MNTKKWYESKTMWVSIIVAFAGILTAVSDSMSAQGVETGIIMTVIGVVNGLLRVVTSSAIE